ncbi:MAG: DUF4173 domain-containing protein [Sphingomonadales bacterium]|nr:MAG: DUF4173 domain-containing protein [Sphingomonadales bacterium]
MSFKIVSSIAAKAAAAAGLVILADWLFWRGGGFGSNLGQFALAWAGISLLLTPAAWRRRGSWIAGGAALLLGAILLDQPGLMALVLFWSALTIAVLLPRSAGFDHAGRWALRLLGHGILSIAGPWRDLFRLRKQKRGGGRGLRPLLPLLPLPLIGGAMFLLLFASANPLISDALSRFGTPQIDFVLVARAIFWGILLTTVWATLRPPRWRIAPMAARDDVMRDVPGVSIGSVTLALLTFNALFAVQNGLDLAFLWSGAPLPAGISLAEYAHRGAYPLIATALLAGLFVLVALRPGSDTAAVPAIRRLVILWIGQNVLLVASSILRTIDYIEVYSLTGLRIAALLWMALVAIGLVLIVWRMLTGKSAAWLVNANAAAAGLVLIGCSAVDLGSVAASWNIRHAREAGGKGAQLDLCYLRELGPSALVSLVRLEMRGGFAPEFGERLRWVRQRVLKETINIQSGGARTWRNTRRLDEVMAMLGGAKLLAAPATGPNGRNCDGTPFPPPPIIPDPVAEIAPAPANPAMPTNPLTPTLPLTKGGER